MFSKRHLLKMNHLMTQIQRLNGFDIIQIHNVSASCWSFIDSHINKRDWFESTISSITNPIQFVLRVEWTQHVIFQRYNDLMNNAIQWITESTRITDDALTKFSFTITLGRMCLGIERRYVLSNSLTHSLDLILEEFT